MNVAAFCKSAAYDEIRSHGDVLTPGRSVGTEGVEEDGKPSDAKMKQLVAEFAGQEAEAARLDAETSADRRVSGTLFTKRDDVVNSSTPYSRK